MMYPLVQDLAADNCSGPQITDDDRRCSCRCSTRVKRPAPRATPRRARGRTAFPSARSLAPASRSCPATTAGASAPDCEPQTNLHALRQFAACAHDLWPLRPETQCPRSGVDLHLDQSCCVEALR